MLNCVFVRHFLFGLVFVGITTCAGTDLPSAAASSSETEGDGHQLFESQLQRAKTYIQDRRQHHQPTRMVLGAREIEKHFETSDMIYLDQQRPDHDYRNANDTEYPTVTMDFNDPAKVKALSTALHEAGGVDLIFTDYSVSKFWKLSFRSTLQDWLSMLSPGGKLRIAVGEFSLITSFPSNQLLLAFSCENCFAQLAAGYGKNQAAIQYIKEVVQSRKYANIGNLISFGGLLLRPWIEEGNSKDGEWSRYNTEIAHKNTLLSQQWHHAPRDQTRAITNEIVDAFVREDEKLFNAWKSNRSPFQQYTLTYHKDAPIDTAAEVEFKRKYPEGHSHFIEFTRIA